MKKITLLAVGISLLLTACGKVESSPAEVVPPPITVYGHGELSSSRQEPVTQGGRASLKDALVQ